MIDYTKLLPAHTEKYIGEHGLFLEVFEGNDAGGQSGLAGGKPPLLFVHGAFTGSWMWSKYMPHFIDAGWKCYAMNMRGHYRSRQLDLSRVTFEDYLDDIHEIIAECGTAPIVIGFSMGGILSQKLAETKAIAGLVLVDSVLSREVHDEVPYLHSGRLVPHIVVPAPVREELFTVDESAEDVAFQRKYLAMESALAYNAFIVSPESQGISVDSSAIACPCLVIKAVGSDNDDRQGKATAEHLRGEYYGLWNTTHTGVLVGQRYYEAVERILEWLKRR